MTLEITETPITLEITGDDSIVLTQSESVSVLELGVAGPQGAAGPPISTGLEAAIPAPAGVSEGTQFLATDTDRLYIAV